MKIQAFASFDEYNDFLCDRDAPLPTVGSCLRIDGYWFIISEEGELKRASMALEAQLVLQYSSCQGGTVA